jgi:hypothetical protein
MHVSGSQPVAGSAAGQIIASCAIRRKSGQANGQFSQTHSPQPSTWIAMNDYHAYLIRMWRDDEQQPWRAELVSPHTGEARRFATPQQLFEYVQQRIEVDPDGEPPASLAAPSHPHRPIETKETDHV